MGFFTPVKNAIKSAGKALLSPLVSWMSAATATLVAGFYGVLKTVFLWILDLISELLGYLLDLLGISNLIPDLALWEELLKSEFGSNFLYVASDIGLPEALGILAAALTIKLIRMAIPFL